MQPSAPSTESAEEVFTLPWQQFRRPWVRIILRYTHGILERLLGLTRLQHIYLQTRADTSERTFPSRVLAVMKTRIDVSNEDVNHIPKAGPLAIIANHPFGATEGIALLELINRQRSDVKVLGNFILKRIPELREHIFFVDPFGLATSASRNVNAIRQALHWLRDGHALIIFPAGEVASFEPRAFRVRDAQWHVSVMTLLRRASDALSILPIYIPGSASLFFHLAGKIHPRLRTLLLPWEMLRLRNRTLPLYIGTPIASSELFKRFQADADALRYLRFRTFLLEGRRRVTWFDEQMQRLTLDTTERVNEPVIAPVPAERLEAELSALPPEATLFTTEEHIVYAVKGAKIPITLPEIGRLRELTFRAVGEGTGHTSDTDEFDLSYYQIILWHKQQRNIIGCYRLALSDVLVEEKGLNALYTRTLFQFDERFLGHLPGPAIELGRSFVRPSHQRTFAPLLLLWRGVLTFIARHPRYTTLFGPVSISHNFSEASTTLLIDYLKHHAYDHALANWIAARLPPKFSRFSEWQHEDYAEFRDSENDVRQALSEFENGQQDIPILIRQYMKLGGKIAAFNVDPDFGTAIDGLIFVDLLKASPRDIARYMGKPLYQAYRNAQTKESLCES
ncbi:MAG: lysophospholipid acyltransferase family protein [Kiritimatiellae bacterium]|nr:lysophospholipid acyltransferase family protein [Kiritimatiellia bacterium]